MRAAARASAVQCSAGSNPAGRLPLALISATISLRVIVSSSICRAARSSIGGRLLCICSPNCEACERDSGGMGCEAVFRRAANIWSRISIARRDYARPEVRTFELRAALSLAMLYQATGRDLAVNDLLAPALVGFVEGSELPEVERANQGEWQVCTSCAGLVRTCAPDVSNRPRLQ
jgi:hypothetical protein